jgi:hypothetical protein
MLGKPPASPEKFIAEVPADLLIARRLELDQCQEDLARNPVGRVAVGTEFDPGNLDNLPQR